MIMEKVEKLLIMEFVKCTLSSGWTDEPDFYGIIRDILELHYHGLVELKVIVFFVAGMIPPVG